MEGTHRAGGNYSVGSFSHTLITKPMCVVDLDSSRGHKIFVSQVSRKLFSVPYRAHWQGDILEFADESAVRAWMAEHHFVKDRKPQSVTGTWERQERRHPSQ